MNALRRTKLVTLALLLVGLIASGVAGLPTAYAGAPGRWTQWATGTETVTQPSLLRTADGVLHAVYAKSVPGGYALFHTTFSAAGVQGPTTQVMPAWTGVTDDPVLVQTPDGRLHIIFGGTSTSGVFAEGTLYQAVSADLGASWTIPEESLSATHSGYASYGVGAIALADNTTMQSTVLNSDISVHQGSILPAALPTATDEVYSISGCCAYHTALVQSGDAVWLAWYSNATSGGTWVRQIRPTVGPPMVAPGSTSGGGPQDPDQRVALVNRPGYGPAVLYCSGYPSCRVLLLWDLTTNTTHPIPRSAGAEEYSLSASPSGRLWVAWVNEQNQVFATRSAASGWRFGPNQLLKSPVGSNPLYTIGIEGSLGRADVVVASETALYHQQVVAALSLTASPTSLRVGQARRVVFKVTDAGVPVSGAKVVGAGKSCRTDSSGKCGINYRFTSPKKVKVLAAKTGYAFGRVVVKVRR